jgi:glutamine cyclotransferase
MRVKQFPFFLAAFVAFAGCGAGAEQTAAPDPAPPPVQSFEVVNRYPHDRSAFTQGLFYRDGWLYESTGLVGQSSLRRVRLADGRVMQSVNLPPGVFGEGSVDWGDEIISLTWRDRVAFRWDLRTFRQKSRLPWTAGEGWGMTRNDRDLIESDGSSYLHFLDPVTLSERRRIQVTAAGRPVESLNELEWVDGEILANIWGTSAIARIDPANGNVRAWIDLSVLAARENGVEDDVLNGIAWDARGRRLFVTGKRWGNLYEIRLRPPSR